MDDRAALFRAALRSCIDARQDVRDPLGDPVWRARSSRQTILFAIQTAIASLAVAAVPTLRTLDGLRAQLVELGRSTPPAWGDQVLSEGEERAILTSRRVRRVWELVNSRLGNAKELDVALFVPSGSETFWTSEKMDWMIYASHESSLTICGDWLLNLVKQAWPAWAEHLYHGYFYRRPPYGESPADG